MTEFSPFHLIVSLIPRPGLIGKTILEIPTGYTWQPPTGNRMKNNFMFHFANNGNGTGGENVPLEPAFMLSGLPMIYPNQTRVCPRRTFLCLAHSCLHLLLFCVSFYNFTLLFTVVMFIPFDCWNVKDPRSFDSIFDLYFIVKKNFFPHFDAVHPNFTQIQP